MLELICIFESSNFLQIPCQGICILLKPALLNLIFSVIGGIVAAILVYRKYKRWWLWLLTPVFAGAVFILVIVIYETGIYLLSHL